jgi:uncharacterized protein YprB with RNaseH-like and TPR domain
MTNHLQPLDEQNADDKPLSRAQRLAIETKPREMPSSVGEATSNGQAPRSASRRGSPAHEMNKRIRDLVREQENALYSASPNTALQNTASSKQQSVADEESSTRSSSWEDIGNEVTSAQPLRGRGLATGAMRGASVGSAQTEVSVLRWIPSPLAPRAILSPPFAPDTLLHEALQGEEKQCDVHGTHYLVSRNAKDYDQAFADLSRRLNRVLESESFPVLSGASVEDLLFVDIETTGLSSSVPLFLVGALRMDGEPRLNLFLARDLPEERALLAAFGELAEGKTLVTFNGKSFDWPYIEGRSHAHRLTLAKPRAHFDLLHHARRHWKHSLPDCKLQTLELYLCGRTRVDDVAGREIPRTYHEFARTHAENGTGAHLLSPILHHNALDILTMAELLCVMTENPR